MSKILQKKVSALQKSIAGFGTEESFIEQDLLALMKCELDNSLILQTYHDVLLFIISHPVNSKILKLAEHELKRIALHLKDPKNGLLTLFADSGLPFTQMITQYSHDLFCWMQDNNWKMEIDSFEESGQDLNSLLKLTLPSLLQEETTAGLENNDLLELLRIKKKNRLRFLLNEFSKLDDSPYVKDHLWLSLKMFVTIQFSQLEQTKSYNRFINRPVFFQKEIMKKFEAEKLLKSNLPSPEKLKTEQLADLVGVIRKSMIQTMRETDTSTYMDESSLRFYNLERGISVAIYGMKPNRQLPLQSYIGYTLFKNGFPAAYGGSWIYGKSAKFGLNVFEAFRGGESGFIMCQLLRVYIQAFDLNDIEIDAFQFGKDNMDGIRSGAFWFYYRFGFRPIDKKLNLLAEKEFQKIKSKPGYRTSEKTLIALAESNISLILGDDKPTQIDTISTLVLKLISNNFGGDSKRASVTCVSKFIQKTKWKEVLNSDEKKVFEEISFLAEVLQINDAGRLSLLKKMVFQKSGSPYEYNKLVTAFFN